MILNFTYFDDFQPLLSVAACIQMQTEWKYIQAENEHNGKNFVDFGL